MRAWIGLLLVVIAVDLANPRVTAAHALDPSLLELEETGDGVEVTWRTPVAQFPGAEIVRPRLPCPAVAPAPSSAGGSTRSAPNPLAAELGLPGVARSTTTPDLRTWIHRWTIDCGAEGLAGRELVVAGLGPQSAEVLVRWVDRRGRSEQRVLDVHRPSTRLPAQPEASAVFGSYLALGVGHILGGFDHLAFVVALVLLVRGRRRLVWTLTAFTVGHSLTLALVVLDVVRLPSAVVEIAIAGSILVLAVELAGRSAERAESEGLFARLPWLMAGSFGLLHGCGFAGALREVGLPQGEVPLALLAFNVGIELGQIVFVSGLWALAWLALGWGGRVILTEKGDVSSWWLGWRHLETLTVYTLGTLAAYWTLGRLASLV